MYAGYNLKMDAADFGAMKQQVGSAVPDSAWSASAEAVKGGLSAFLSGNGRISARKMREAWFPQADGDIHVFLSHAHQDQENAKILARWLYDRFGLKTFIDSTVWGHADKLLRDIDNKYCKKSEDHYDYGKRNLSTAHVHMILMSSLVTMIDRSGCLIFLNTRESVSPSEAITEGSAASSTYSPWIYGEIFFSGLIRQRKPSMVLEEWARIDKASGVPMEYEMSFEHLRDIGWSDLRSWSTNGAGKKGHAALMGLGQLISGTEQWNRLKGRP